MKIPSQLLAFVFAAMAAAAMSCVTDGPALPPHLDPASDQIADSPQPLARSLAGDVPREAQPLEERPTVPPTGQSGHGHGAPGMDQPPDPQSPAYSCPMHPEVRQSAPGECPKCGMKLVREPAPALDAGSPAPKAAPPSAKPRSPAAEKPPAAPAEVTYTCPMHPEVRQPKPGRCPKCGMNLVPADDPHGGHP